MQDPRLDAGALISLCALGTATRRTILPQAVRNAIDDLVGFVWCPVGDVVMAQIRELVATRSLEPITRDGGVHMRTTAVGYDRFKELMLSPADGPRSLLGQIAIRLKLAHLDLLTCERRCDVLSALIADHERDIALLKVDLGPIWRGSFGRQWAERDAAKLAEDLALLRRQLAHADEPIECFDRQIRACA